MLVQCNQSVIVHAGKGKLYYCCAVETDSVLLVCMLFLENLKVSRQACFSSHVCQLKVRTEDLIFSNAGAVESKC